MAQTFPVLIALMISLFDHNLFITYEPDSIAPMSPLLASHIMKIAFYFMLLELNFHYKDFRKISNFALGIFEFIASLFFMETVLAYGWFPLEKKLMEQVPNVLKTIYYSNSQNSAVRALIECLSTDYFLMFLSYFVSILFLCCVLHATRAVDFRLIRYIGVLFFIKDTVKKMRRGILKMYYRVNVFAVNRQVAIETYCSAHQRLHKLEKCQMGCGRYYT